MDFYSRKDYWNAVMIRRLKQRRQELGISPEEIAVTIGMSLQEFLMCERGDVPLSAVHLYRISLVYGVSPSYFFEEEDDA